MRSPFPGMDPYLEQHWLDVHPALCTYARDALNPQLGGDLVARLGERVLIESPGDASRHIMPDVRVVEHTLPESWAAAPEPAEGGLTVAEPVVLTWEVEPLHQPFVEIIEPRGGTVITVVEFVSPTNKLPGSGCEQYRRKRRQLYDGRVNLVEIDLTREGDLTVLPDEVPVRQRLGATYVVTVYRASRPGSVGLHPIGLAECLPMIKIPLRKTDADVALNLQALVDQAYRNGRYRMTLDYSKPCVPPLSYDEATWAAGVIRAAGWSPQGARA